jgi:hypothetical protein
VVEIDVDVIVIVIDIIVIDIDVIIVGRSERRQSIRLMNNARIIYSSSSSPIYILHDK